MQTARKTLKNQRGEANYFSTVVFIFIAVVLLAFIIDLFSIISTKQELDHAADQMVKQIQLSGGVNSETDSLFDFLCSEIEGAENITYSIDATYKSPTPSGMSRAIQLGTPFYTGGSMLVRGMSFMKLVLFRRVPVKQALKLFRKDQRTDYESRVMRLAHQALLSTAEIIKCVEQGVSVLPNENTLIIAFLDICIPCTRMPVSNGVKNRPLS